MNANSTDLSHSFVQARNAVMEAIGRDWMPSSIGPDVYVEPGQKFEAGRPDAAWLPTGAKDCPLHTHSQEAVSWTNGLTVYYLTARRRMWKALATTEMCTWIPMESKPAAEAALTWLVQWSNEYAERRTVV